MRALATSAVLSSLVLGGCLTTAAAQETNVGSYGATDLAQGGQVADVDVPVGVIPQPTLESPGIVAGVTLGELYTDNLRLANQGEPKQTSWITQVQPFFKWARNGPRFAGSVDYQLTGYLYAGQSDSNQLAHDLKARGTFAVVPQHLFIDGSASYGREVINSENPSGSGTFFLDGNRANVTTGVLSPYWVQDLGNVGLMRLRYTVGRVLYDQHGISGQNRDLLNGITDSTSHGWQFSLVSPEGRTWGWTADYSDQRIDRDGGQSIDYAMAKLGTSLQISDRTTLLAEGGKESQFLPDGTSRKLGSWFWNAGAEWQDPRNSLKLMVGHRFYGRSYEFSWRRTAARLNTSVSYVEKPTDLNQQLLGQDSAQAVISPIGASNLPSLRDRQVYLMKRGTASATYEMPRGSLRLTLYDERRTYFILDDRQERVANVNIDWQFNAGPFTTITPTVGWQRYRFLEGQVRYNRFAQLAFAHQWDPKNFATLKLRHDSSNVNQFGGVQAARDYGVNVVFLQLTHLF